MAGRTLMASRNSTGNTSERWDVLPRPLIVAPTPTPFSADGGIDCDAMVGNIAKWRETSLSGFVLNTENGEESFLSEEERMTLIRTVAEVREDRLLIAGVDHPSTLETLRRAEVYAEAGADLIRLRFPRGTQIDSYLNEVLPRMPRRVMLIHQMAPGMFLSHGTANAGTPQQIGEWASLPNVVGYIASADMRFETQVRFHVPSHIQFWTANGSLVLAGILAGADGACMMLANIFPNEARKIFLALEESDYRTAHRLQQQLVSADWEILSRRAAGLKAALQLLGFQTGDPRSPQSACDEASRASIAAALKLDGRTS